jgi:hypothetical protein
MQRSLQRLSFAFVIGSHSCYCSWPPWSQPMSWKCVSNLDNTWQEHERLYSCCQTSWRSLYFIMCTFLSKGLGNRCRLILWGTRNSHYGLEHHVNFCKGRWFYRNEIYLDTLTKKLEFILSSSMVNLLEHLQGRNHDICLLVMSICVILWLLHFPLCQFPVC